MCPHIEETSQICLNSNETEKFKIKEVMDCDSRNLIYCIVCMGCGEKYIGQAGDVIRNRVRVHKQQILHEDKRMFKTERQQDLKLAKNNIYCHVTWSRTSAHITTFQHVLLTPW